MPGRMPISQTIRVLYLLLLFGLVGLLLRSIDFSQLVGLKFAILPILAAVVVGILNRYWMAFVLRYSMQSVGVSAGVHYSKYVQYFASTWLSRYLFLKGAWLGHRLVSKKTISASSSQVSFGSVLENFGLIAANTVFAFLLLFFGPVDFLFSWLPSGFLTISLTFIALIALAPWAIRKTSIWWSRRRGNGTIHVRYSAAFRVLLLQLVTVFLSGLSTVLLVASIAGSGVFQNFVYLLALVSLGNLAGTLAFFAPAGIGVREGVLIGGLGTILSLEFATVVALLARVWSVGVDLLFFGVSRFHFGTHTE